MTENLQNLDPKAASEFWLRRCFELARQARQRGDHPFGAVLVNAAGECILEAENTVETTADITAHAELNLVKQARRHWSADQLAHCTLYTSTEPCPMCAGAIFWGNIRQVVFGLSEAGLYDIIGTHSEEVLMLPCAEVFERGKKNIQVKGPFLTSEARSVHEGFWSP